MPASDRGWIVTREEFASWITLDTLDFAVLKKPGFVVCHPSKEGPWSSLVGAAREYFGLPVIHMPFRLDRETSGVWLAVKNRTLASEWQRAVQRRAVKKIYLAIVEGRLHQAMTVNQPIGPAEGSQVRLKRAVRVDGQPAVTHFSPIDWRGDRSLLRVETETGRLHQIRVHAQWLGHSIVGDKLYGPDESLFLDFMERGDVGRVAAELPLPRQALHCESVALETERGPQFFTVPLADDLRSFWQSLTP